MELYTNNNFDNLDYMDLHLVNGRGVLGLISGVFEVVAGGLMVAGGVLSATAPEPAVSKAVAVVAIAGGTATVINGISNIKDNWVK